MAEKICYSDKINYKGQEARLVDADCDGLISAGGKDGLEVKQASGQLQIKTADAFFKETGLEPWQKFKMNALTDFLGAPFSNIFQFYDPRNETSNGINPSLIDTWCEQSSAQVCSWRAPSGLAKTIFSRDEAIRRADLFVEKASEAMKPFFVAETTDEKAVFCLSESGQTLTSKIDYYLQAAQILYQSYGPVTEMFHGVKQMRADYFEQKTSIENGIALTELLQLVKLLRDVYPHSLLAHKDSGRVLFSSEEFYSLKNKFGTLGAVHGTLDKFNNAFAQFRKKYPKLIQAYESQDGKKYFGGERYASFMVDWNALIDSRVTVTCDARGLKGLRGGCPWLGDSFTFGPLRDVLK